MDKKKYENIPVSQVGTDYQNLLGRANVEIDEHGDCYIYIKTSNSQLVDFLNKGRLRGLELSAFIDSVDVDPDA